MDSSTIYKNIRKGFSKHEFKTPAMKELAIERAKVCSKCENCDPDFSFKKLVGTDFIQEVKGIGCKLCTGCILHVKIRQLHSKCPDKKWGEDILLTT